MNTISAPYPQNDCETVAEYNRKHVGKAWTIVGMTWQGSAYCRRCVAEWPTYEHDLVEGPTPVFASDEYDELVCDTCHEYLW